MMKKNICIDLLTFSLVLFFFFCRLSAPTTVAEGPVGGRWLLLPTTPSCCGQPLIPPGTRARPTDVGFSWRSWGRCWCPRKFCGDRVPPAHQLPLPYWRSYSTQTQPLAQPQPQTPPNTGGFACSALGRGRKVQPLASSVASMPARTTLQLFAAPATDSTEHTLTHSH